MSIFDVYTKKPARNHFPLSHSRTYTMQNFGVLYPTLCKELMPGDVFKHSHEHFAQFMPLSSTVLHRFKVQTFYFFVPNRIIWDEFNDFINMDPNKFLNPPVHPYLYLSDLFNGISTSPAFPSGFLSHGSLFDYLGYRTYDFRNGSIYWNNSPATNYWDAGNSTRISALPLRAYQKIWYDYFRDEECNASNSENCKTSGGNAWEDQLFFLRSKTWKKDPFTSTLKATTPHGYVPQIGPTIKLEDIRNLNATTTFFEKIMRGGDRAQEFIHTIFGVKAKDYRLDMPEFLNASESTIILGNVFNSEASTGKDDLAQGYTVSTARTSSVAGGFRYQAREFGWLIGLAALVPDSVYFQGQPVELMHRDNNLGYPFPDFARIGDQAVTAREIYEVPEYSGTPSGKDYNDAVFGYAPRYWQYKYFPSTIHGMFKMPTFYSYHDARVIGASPSRNANFTYIANFTGNGRVSHIYPDPSSSAQLLYFGSSPDPSRLNRIFNVTSATPGELYPPICQCQIFHNISGLRPLPFSSIPRI